MPSIWSSLLGAKRRTDQAASVGTDERMTIDEWASQFSYDGSNYQLFGSSYRTGLRQEDPGDNFIAIVQSAYKTSGVVFATQLARQIIFCEGQFAWQNLDHFGAPADLAERPALLREPWVNGTTADLLGRAIQDSDFAGNSYFVLDNDANTGQLKLRRLRPDWVRVILDAAPAEATRSNITAYQYRPGGVDGHAEYFLPHEIAHWAPLPDPEAQYLGMSWITPVIREVMADKAAVLHKLKYFENGTVPGLAVSFKETVTKDQFEDFMRLMEAKSGTTNAYSTLYLGGGADVTPIGADMRQVDFRSMQGVGEARIAAAGRVPALIVGLSEGMQKSALNDSSWRAAKDQFAETTLRPLWHSFGAALQPLLVNAGLRPRPNMRLWYDESGIAFLRADQKELADLRNKQANTMAQLIMAGFTPDSIVTAIQKDDWSLLTHTGLFSVQLIPPGVIATAGNHTNGGAVLAKDGKETKSAIDLLAPEQRARLNELLSVSALPQGGNQ